MVLSARLSFVSDVKAAKLKLDYDIVICGGGMIGAALATQLAPYGFSIAMLETKAPHSFDLSQAFDLRICALSPKSQQVMQASSAWHKLQAMRLCPYRRMRVWEVAGFGDLTFNAQQVGASELGHIVENRLVQLSLWQALAGYSNVDILCPVSPTSFAYHEGMCNIKLDAGSNIRTRLVIGADGAQSKVRKAFAIGVNSGQYQQACLVASVNTELGQQDMTWQRFVATGPQAFLPLLGQHGSVVWYHQVDQVRALSKLSGAQLGQQIMQQFPSQLGQIEVTNHASFGLQKQHAKQYVAPGVALLGDAAHVINPLAGQGVNLGFQDVACLAQVLGEASRGKQDWASLDVLKQYQRQRKLSNSLMLHTMDAFHHGFSQPHSAAKWMRNLVLATAKVPGLKKRVIRYAMGL